MRTEDIHNLLTEKFTEEDFRDCFVVGIEMTGKKISVFIDSDKSVTLETCRSLSRYLENIFDEQQWFGEDYVLEVSSSGLSRPLVFPRQFVKNIGRDLEIFIPDGSRLEGKILEADNRQVTIGYENVRRENKKKIKNIVRKSEKRKKINRKKHCQNSSFQGKLSKSKVE